MSVWSLLNEGFRAAEVKEGGEYQPLPTGTYEAVVSDVELDSEKGVLVRTFTVTSQGPYHGSKHRDWMNFIKKDGTQNEITTSRLKTEMYRMDPDWLDLELSDCIVPFATAIKGAAVTIYYSMKESTYQGKKYKNTTININKFHFDQPAAPEPAPVAAKAPKAPPAAKKTPQMPPTMATAAISTEDIPF